MGYPRILDAGEQGLTVEMGEGIDPGVNDLVIGFYRHMAGLSLDGWIEAIPSYRSLLVLFDPVRLPRNNLRAILKKELSRIRTETVRNGNLITIPVVYGGDYGPDLNDVALHGRTDPEKVIQLHSSSDYRVYMLGFTPGFPYLGGLDERIATPRLDSPRTTIPAGSVGIAGTQTGVYPIDSPGGWRLIGRTPLQLFDPERKNPALIQPGDQVRFAPISEAQFQQVSKQEVREIGEQEEDESNALCRVLQPGLMTIVQDSGRWGYQHLGVPTSGAMDMKALRLANLLLRNSENAAVLEMTMAGPSLQFCQNTCVVVAGADLGAVLDEQPIPLWTSVPVKAGSILSFTGRRSGCRAYLAVAGGFKVSLCMASAATYLRGGFGGFRGRPLQTGDLLGCYLGNGAESGLSVPAALTAYLHDDRPLPVVPGPQEDMFYPEMVNVFYESVYTVSAQSDRMGSRLEGPLLKHRFGADIISDGIPPGAVQVPGHGTPIVMTADRQTTGGYAKIGVMTRRGLDQLAQKIPGDPVRFQRIDANAAENIFLQEENAVKQWQESFSKSTHKNHWRLTINGQTYMVTVQAKE